MSFLARKPRCCFTDEESQFGSTDEEAKIMSYCGLAEEEAELLPF